MPDPKLHTQAIGDPTSTAAGEVGVSAECLREARREPIRLVLRNERLAREMLLREVAFRLAKRGSRLATTGRWLATTATFAEPGPVSSIVTLAWPPIASADMPAGGGP